MIEGNVLIKKLHQLKVKIESNEVCVSELCKDIDRIMNEYDKFKLGFACSDEELKALVKETKDYAMQLKLE